MKIRNTIFFGTIAGLFYLLSVIGSSCAQIGMPTGGARDTIPPKLLNSTPPNHSIHFKANKITLTFDEYVQLSNLQENLLVSPTPKINPNIDFKLKQVTIKIRDTLLPNTTYSFQLGNSIQDVNENNPFPNFTYVFSTGSYIDSLTFSGNVQLAETGKVDTTLLVLLYNDLSDSAVYKKKPKYITRVNTKGDFQFQNLAGGTYHVFALKDESGQKIYSSKTQLFAFADSAIKVAKEVSPIKLYAFVEEKETPKAASGTNKKPEKELKFTTSLTNKTQDLLTPLTLEFPEPLKHFDSLHIKMTDTLFNPIPSTIASLDTTRKKVIIRNNWVENSFYKLIIDKNFATDTSGRALAKNDTLSFKTKREGEYGSIKINFKNLEKFKHPVLQFLANNVVVNAFPLTSATFYQKLFNPGEYELRILDDDNQNGIWDTGNYDHKKQPEKVYSISQTLSIRADWDNERDIVL
jgi:uncharacterized protein (DUF2141 family)